MVMIAVLQVQNRFLGIIDLGLGLPVSEDCQQELSVLLQPVVQSAPHDSFLFNVLFMDELPLFEGTSRPIVVGPGKVVGHSFVSHALQIAGKSGVSGRLVSHFLGQVTQFIVLGEALFLQGLLLIHNHLHLH